MKAALFDLDDTLYDHKYHRICALQTLQQKHPELRHIPLDVLEVEHERHLQANYGQLLEGRISLADARIERIRNLCAACDLHLSPEQAVETTELFRKTYQDNQRAVPGAIDLLHQLKNRITLGVVTNGLVEIQLEKLRICGMERLFSFVLVSEEIGAKKPDQAIFIEALHRAGAQPEEAVFVGDAWETDIIGSHQCGIRTIWLNRYGATCLDPDITTEIRALAPVQQIVDLIFKETP